MDKIRRLAARLRRGAKEPRQPLLSDEMDAEYAAFVSDAVNRIDNHFDIAGFVVAVLDESGMPSEAQAVSQLLSGSERVQKAKKLAEGTPHLERPTECKRCGSELRKGYCSDETCSFSDRLQSDPEGWHRHPDRPDPRSSALRSQRRAAAPPLDKTWYCHGCGIGASERHPLKDSRGAAAGTPACKSCGKPMTTDIQLKDRGAGRTGQVETGPPPGATPGDSMKWYCHDCGTSKRHPLAEGCPECASCGKPMVSDRHLEDR